MQISKLSVTLEKKKLSEKTEGISPLHLFYCTWNNQVKVKLTLDVYTHVVNKVTLFYYRLLKIMFVRIIAEFLDSPFVCLEVVVDEPQAVVVAGVGLAGWGEGLVTLVGRQSWRDRGGGGGEGRRE